MTVSTKRKLGTPADGDTGLFAVYTQSVDDKLTAGAVGLLSDDSVLNRTRSARLRVTRRDRYSPHSYRTRSHTECIGSYRPLNSLWCNWPFSNLAYNKV